MRNGGAASLQAQWSHGRRDAGSLHPSFSNGSQPGGDGQTDHRTICPSAVACGTAEAGRTAPKLDGLNLWESLQGKTKTHPRKSLLYWHGWAMPQAIRVGDFKLYLDKVKEIPGTNKGPALIDLSKDPAKEKDLASEYPEKVKDMKGLAEKLLSEIEENSISLGGPASPRKQNKKGAFWLK